MTSLSYCVENIIFEKLKRAYDWKYSKNVSKKAFLKGNKLYFKWLCLRNYLILSWQRRLSYRSQSIDLQSKSVDWFLYDNGLRHERVKVIMLNLMMSDTVSLYLIFICLPYALFPIHPEYFEIFACVCKTKLNHGWT